MMSTRHRLTRDMRVSFSILEIYELVTDLLDLRHGDEETLLTTNALYHLAKAVAMVGRSGKRYRIDIKNQTFRELTRDRTWFANFR